MTDTLRIPRPHVSYGPRDMPVDEADAMYLREAARNITHSRCMGSNLTATVVKLLNDCADAIDHPAPSPRPGLCACGLPGCSDEPDTAGRCTCGMAEQERTGHDPEHAEWCEVAPEPVPAGSDTADERSISLANECVGFGGTLSVPSPAPEDERCTCGDFAGTSVHYVDCPIHGQSASEDEREYDPFGDPDPVPTNWWHTQSGRAAHDAALVARTRTQVAGEIERDILAARRHMCNVTGTGPGHPTAQAYDDSAPIAARAATKAVS